MKSDQAQASSNKTSWSGIKSSGGMLAIVIFFSIGISLFVKPILKERKNNKANTLNTLKHRWGGSQVIKGPTLVIPYTEKQISHENVFENGIYVRKQKETVHKREAFFLPKSLNIEASAASETRYISIYKVPVYESKVNVSSVFHIESIEKIKQNNAKIQWDKAYIAFQIKDIHGLAKVSKLKAFKKEFNVDVKVAPPGHKVLFAKLNEISSDSIKDAFEVSYSMDIKGSEDLFFMAGAKNTTVKLHSDWPHPGFQGDFLPTQRRIDADGFKAQWDIPSLSSGLELSWTGNYRGISTVTYDQLGKVNAKNQFGVRLVKPVNIYQKNTRTTKYALLVILLTFASFFIISVLSKLRLHPMHYFFVGCSIIMFYVLLISTSEHIGFGPGYFISSLLTIALISSYGRSLFKSVKKAFSISTILSSLFSFLFIVFINQDYALLIGSVGMFITLALVMYISRNINWTTLEINNS